VQGINASLPGSLRPVNFFWAEAFSRFVPDAAADGDSFNPSNARIGALQLQLTKTRSSLSFYLDTT
jgi:hypothetical protein